MNTGLSEETSPKRSHMMGAFIFALKVLFGIVIIIITIPALLMGLIFYFHTHPYGNSRFDQAEWLLHEQGDESRCSMASTIIDEVIKPNMSRTKIESILGANTKPHFIESNQTKTYAYSLGWCSPIAWDPYLLIIHYDLKDEVIEAYNIQG